MTNGEVQLQKQPHQILELELSLNMNFSESPDCFYFRDDDKEDKFPALKDIGPPTQLQREWVGDPDLAELSQLQRKDLQYNQFQFKQAAGRM